VTEKEQQQIF